LGPVGPTQKDEFYKSIDLFLFPSQFAQEAAPLVLYEAQSAGVPCLASDRGVIAEMLGGDVWDEKSSFGNFVLEYISKNAWTPFAIADRAAALHARMRIEAETSKQQLNELVELLAHPAT
jgi:glycosyltransferase involved in cell wall biosynthesis